MVIVLASLLVWSIPEDATGREVEETQEPSDGPRWLLTSAVRTRPGGAVVGAEALYDLAESVALGAFLSYAYYWAEMGAKLEWRYLGGFLVGGLWLGLEPGDFIPKGQEGDSRKPGLRGLCRGRLELNFKLERLWVYDRLTIEGRVRAFEERDPYRDAELGTELSVEEAIAPLFRIAGWGDRSALWIYAELTTAFEVDAGLLDFRPSGGLIVEEMLPGVTIDLDLYHSLRSGSLRGWGSLVFVWWRF